MRLAPAVDPRWFSEAERSALLLDGECVPLGLSLVPVGAPLDPETRAASLLPAVDRYDLVAELRTAAWVHGAIAELPDPLALAVDLRRSSRTKLVHPAPREALFRPEDLVRLGGTRVTTPLKTAYELLRRDEDEDPAVGAVVTALLLLGGHSPAIAAALAHLQPAAVGKQRAIDRLAALPVSPR